jgi:nitric oxide synthase-interacting protein
VSQKKDIKRQKEKLEMLKKEAEEEKARAKEGARERVLLEFEKSQLGLTGAPAAAAATTPGADSNEGEVTRDRILIWSFIM